MRYGVKKSARGPHKNIEPILRDIIVIGSLTIPGLVWIGATGPIAPYFDDSVPQGQFLYVLSKLLGLYALVFLWYQVLNGILRDKMEALIGYKWAETLHKKGGVLVLLLALAHGGLFIAAVSLRQGHFASILIIPTFFDTYYNTILSIGILSGWFLLMAFIAGMVRDAFPRIWKKFHYLGLIAFICVYFHGLLIGSESRAGAMLYLYVVLGVILLFATAYRINRDLLRLGLSPRARENRASTAAENEHRSPVYFSEIDQ